MNKRPDRSLRLVATDTRGDIDRPLYKGKVIVKRLGHYSDTPHEISLPLVAWLAPKGEK